MYLVYFSLLAFLLKIYYKPIYSLLLLTLQVIDGGDLDINFVVQAPTGRLIVPDIRKKGDLHKLAIVNIFMLRFVYTLSQKLIYKCYCRLFCKI